MEIDRRQLKLRAREYVLRPRSKVLMHSLVFVVVVGLLNYLANRVMYGRITDADVSRYYELVGEGNLDYAAQFLDTLLPTRMAYGIKLLISIVISVLNAGYIIYLLNVIRGREAVLGNLLDGFGNFFRIILLDIARTVMLALWSILLIFPAFIAFYGYRLAVYILMDNPGMSPFRCLSMSRKLMKGHKWELFKLDVSFILWTIAQTVPVVGTIAAIFGTPYISMTQALFYEEIVHGGTETTGEPVYTDNT